MGNAVFLSMDFPDTILAVSTSPELPPSGRQLMLFRVSKFSKLLNYMQREVAKTVVFSGLLVVWTYFRIYLNSNMLWSVWFEFDLIPCVTSSLYPKMHLNFVTLRAETMQWAPEKGVWLAWWIRYQIFIPLLLLLCLNIFWYFLILRIAYRYVRPRLRLN
jgi:acyl-CoA-dependent ceramide synthase